MEDDSSSQKEDQALLESEEIPANDLHETDGTIDVSKEAVILSSPTLSSGSFLQEEQQINEPLLPTDKKTQDDSTTAPQTTNEDEDESTPDLADSSGELAQPHENQQSLHSSPSNRTPADEKASTTASIPITSQTTETNEGIGYSPNFGEIKKKFEHMKFAPKPPSTISKKKDQIRHPTLSLPILDIGLKKKEINILYIGRSSSGKSTLLNATRILLGFKKLSDAMEEAEKKFEQREKLILAPQKICIKDDKDMDHTFYAESEFEHEKHNFFGEIGQSCTKWPASFTLEFGNDGDGKTVIRLIDTPGIDDTKNRDEQIQSLIINKISQYGTIDLICVALKADEHLFDQKFQDALGKIFSNFTSDVGPNILLCYTNFSYGSNCQTRNLVKLFLESLPESTKFNRERSAKFNNTFVQYVLAKRIRPNIETDRIVHGTSGGRQGFEPDFSDAKNELLKLLKYADECEAYNVNKSISLGLARSLAKLIPSTAFHIACGLQKTKDDLNRSKEELSKMDAKLGNQAFIINAAKELMTFHLVEGERSYKHVCLHSECIEKFEKGGEAENPPCCKSCWLWRCVLRCGCRWCDCISYSTMTCNKCGHPAQDHHHVNRIRKQIPIPLENDEITEIISKFHRAETPVTREELLEEIRIKTIDSRTQKINEYAEEISTIVWTCAVIQIFLQYNSFENNVSDMFESLIKNEKIKAQKGNSDMGPLISLMIEDYEQTKAEILRGAQAGTGIASYESVLDLIGHLKKLANSGIKFRGCIEKDLMQKRVHVDNIVKMPRNFRL